jgi:quercetin dioxygenase-like cupin family protein
MDEERTSPGSEPSLTIDRLVHHDDRILAAPVLRFELQAQLNELRRKRSYGSGGPTGKTLVKEPDLRIVLMALGAGSRMEKHRASGPISIHVIDGRIRIHLPTASTELVHGELLALESNIAHDVEAIEDAAFLLTLGRTTYQHVSDQHEPRA